MPSLTGVQGEISPRGVCISGTDSESCWPPAPLIPPSSHVCRASAGRSLAQCISAHLRSSCICTRFLPVRLARLPVLHTWTQE